MTLEEQDAYFMSCKEQFIARNMGNDDAATAYCYPKAYGSETSGGGEPNTYPRPAPGNTCYGEQAPCNPYIRPN